MKNLIQQFVVELPGCGPIYPLRIPAQCREIAVVQPWPSQAFGELAVGVVVSIPEDAEAAPPTWNTRYFQLVLDGEALPENFSGWIGAVSFGPGKAIVHIIEVTQ